jgi:hypothetical protein
MDYKTKYVRSSVIKRELLSLVEKQPDGTEKSIKIRLKGDAVDSFYEFLDKTIQDAVKKVLDALPRKSKGAQKGLLKEVTIKKETVEEAQKTE